MSLSVKCKLQHIILTLSAVEKDLLLHNNHSDHELLNPRPLP